MKKMAITDFSRTGFIRSLSYKFAIFALMTVLTPAAGLAADLDKVLAQMDAASAKFQNAQADFATDNYTKVVDDHEQQSGTTYFERSGGQTQMAAVIQKPAPKTVVYKDGALSYYDPALDQVNVFSAGKNKAQYESFLTLGFGGSGKDLKAAWQIADLGPETIDGVATEKLDLKSQSAKDSAHIDHIAIWVDPTRAVSLKQVFYYSSGDTRATTFSHIKYNQKKLPKGVFDVPKAKNVLQK
jgi:outer membrane lipoprotein-sorting protein